MSTNYYLHTEPTPCPTCGHDTSGGTPRHIGKSSAGWCFSLHVYPDEGIHDLSDWEREWSKPGVVIKDEYGDVMDAAAMKAKITERVWRGKDEPPSNGPNGLLRHDIRYNCIGHGAGTWDLIVGDFS